jgi:hypothetical protein
MTEAANGPMSPNSAMLMATANDMHRAAPAELHLERSPSARPAWRGSGGDDENNQRDGRD